jgi:hypothetical protein
MSMFMQEIIFVESNCLSFSQTMQDLIINLKKEDSLHLYYDMLMPGVLTISVIITSLVTISMISVNTVLGTQDENNVTLTVLFNQIIKS